MKRKPGIGYALGVYWLIVGCNPYAEMAMLDKDIPRVETPSEQIALVRAKIINGQLAQTTLFDRENRTLEEYNFGRTNSKLLNQYDGSLKVRSVTYYHNDDNMPGTNDLTVHQYVYDKQGRLYQETVAGRKWERLISYSFAANGDTIRSETPDSDGATLADVNQWERNGKGQLIRHFQLYVLPPHNGKSDTITHLSRRYDYSSDGRLQRTWNDGKYPEPIRYQYDRSGKLIIELHEHTINQTTGDVSTYRKADTIRYHYEAFDPKRHLPLYIPPLD